MSEAQTWREARILHTDTAQALIQVKYLGDASVHTIAFDNNGGGDTDALLVSIVEGTTTTTFDVDGADETAATLQALVDGINAIEDSNGKKNWRARRANGTADYSLDSDNFIDMAATAVGRQWSSLLYRDASEITATSLRIAIPEFTDSVNNDPCQGEIEIGLIRGNATYGSGAVSVSVSRDPGKAATDEELILPGVAAANTTVNGDIFNNLDAPLRFRGPALIEVVGTLALSACDFRVLYRQGIGNN